MEHDTEPPEAEPERSPAQTGQPRVDAAIMPLAELDELPVSEHPQVFERIHGELVEVLGELHSGAEPAGHAEPAESA